MQHCGGSDNGDFTARQVMFTSRVVDDWLFLCGIDVEAPMDVGGIVARGGRMFGVMNQGLGGNRILHDVRGDSGVKRFDRDVLAQPGVAHAIIVLGINDIRNRLGLKEEVVTAQELIGGFAQMAMRARAHGIKIFGGTLTPFENETFLRGAYTPEGEAKRMDQERRRLRCRGRLRPSAARP
jgi:hypothetical protein